MGDRVCHVDYNISCNREIIAVALAGCAQIILVALAVSDQITPVALAGCNHLIALALAGFALRDMTLHFMRRHLHYVFFMWRDHTYLCSQGL